jgi:hypothetical protein
MPLAGRAAALKATSLVATSSTDVACTRSTGVGSANGYVQVTNVALRHIEPDTNPELYLNSTLVSSTNYTVNYVQGKFDWQSGDPAAGTYTADLSYVTASNVAGGREWTLNLEQDMFEVTEFGSSGWKEFMPNMAGAQITVGKYWTDPTFFDYLEVSGKFLVELITSSTGGWRYETYARVVSDQLGAGVDSLVTETINLVADGQVYYTTA